LKRWKDINSIHCILTVLELSRYRSLGDFCRTSWLLVRAYDRQVVTVFDRATCGSVRLWFSPWLCSSVHPSVRPPWRLGPVPLGIKIKMLLRGRATFWSNVESQVQGKWRNRNLAAYDPIFFKYRQQCSSSGAGMLAVPCSTDSLLCIHSWVVWVWFISDIWMHYYNVGTLLLWRCCRYSRFLTCLRLQRFRHRRNKFDVTWHFHAGVNTLVSRPRLYVIDFSTVLAWNLISAHIGYLIPWIYIHRCWWRTGVATLSAYSSGWGSNFGLGAQSPKYRSALKFW